MIKKALMTLAMLCAFVAPAIAQPAITSITETDLNTVVVTFSEAVEDATGTFSILETVPATGDFDWTDPDSNEMAAWSQTLVGYISPFTPEIVANLKTIRDRGVVQGREEGRMGQFGDSISLSDAFWETVLRWGYWNLDMNFDLGDWGANQDDSRPGTILEWVDLEWWALETTGTYRGSAFGYTLADWVGINLPYVAIVTNGVNSSWATFMLGTNDILDGKVLTDSSQLANWKAVYKNTMQAMIDLGCIPIPSTIPPVFIDHDGSRDGTDFVTANELNVIIIEAANEMLLPYIDYNAAIRLNQPGDSSTPGVSGNWLGNLMGDGGIHPNDAPGSPTEETGWQTNPNLDPHSNLTSDGMWGADVKGGYQMRTFLSLAAGLKLRLIVFDETSPAEGTANPATPFNPSATVYGSPNPEDVTLTIDVGNTLELAKEYTVTATDIEDLGGGNPNTSNLAFTVTYVAPDTTIPVLSSTATATDDNTVVITFDEDIDATSATTATYVFSPTLTVASVSRTAYAEITIDVNETFLDGGHTITVTGVEDLSGNPMEAGSTTSFPYATVPDPDAPRILGAAFTGNVSLEVYYDKEIDVNNFNANVSSFHLYVWDGDSYLDNEVTIVGTGAAFDDATNGWTSIVSTNIVWTTGNWYVIVADPGVLMNTSGAANTVSQTWDWAHGDVGSTPAPNLSDPDAPFIQTGDVTSTNIVRLICDKWFDPTVLTNNPTKVHLYLWDGVTPYLDNEFDIVWYITVDGRTFDNVSYSSTYDGYDTRLYIGGTPAAASFDQGFWYIWVIEPGVLISEFGVVQNEEQTYYWDEGSGVAAPTLGDTAPPVFIDFSITNLSTVTATFDETVDALSALNIANWAIYTTGPPVGTDEAISGISVVDAVATITLTTPLEYATNYTLEITNIGDTNSNFQANPQTLTATTAATPDLTEPQIISVLQNSINSVRVLFDEDVQYATNTDNWSLVPTSGTISNIIQTAGNAAEYTITYSTDFSYSTLYTLSVVAGTTPIVDLNNNFVNSSFDSDQFTTGAAPVAGEFVIPIIVHNGERHVVTKVITAGVPLSKGLLTDLSTVAVVAEDGSNVGPVSATEVMGWNDGSNEVRFMHVNWPAVITATDTVKYYVTNTRTPETTSYLAINSNLTNYVVRTGKARFTINKEDFRIFDQVEISPTGNDSYTVSALNYQNSRGIYVDDMLLGELVAHSIAPTSYEIVEQNNTKIVLRFSGFLATPDGLTTTEYRYRAFMYFYANSAEARIDLKISNDNVGEFACNSGDTYMDSWFFFTPLDDPDLPTSYVVDQRYYNPESLYINDGGIDLSSVITNGTFNITLENFTTYSDALATGERAYVFQDGFYDSHVDFNPQYLEAKVMNTTGYHIKHGIINIESTVSSSTTANATGALTLTNGSSMKLGVAVKEFNKMGPIGLSSYADGRIVANVWHEDQREPYPINRLVGSTHSIVFSFDTDTAEVEDHVRSVAATTPAIVDPHWSAITDFYKPFAPADESIAAGGTFAEFSKMQYIIGSYKDQVPGIILGNYATGQLLQSQARNNVYGKRDWGATISGFFGDAGDWGNNEYDFMYGMAIASVRAGSADYYKHNYYYSRQMFDWVYNSSTQYFKKYDTRTTPDADCYWIQYQLSQHRYDTFEDRLHRYGAIIDLDPRQCSEPTPDPDCVDDGYAIVDYPGLPAGKLAKAGHQPMQGFIYAYYSSGDYDIKEDWINMMEVNRWKVIPQELPAGADDPGSNLSSIDNTGEPRANGWLAGALTEAWRLTGDDVYRQKVITLMNYHNFNLYDWALNPLDGYTRDEVSYEGSEDWIPFNQFAWMLDAYLFFEEELNFAGLSVPTTNGLNLSNQLLANFLYDYSWAPSTGYSGTGSYVNNLYFLIGTISSASGTNIESTPIFESLARGALTGLLTTEMGSRSDQGLIMVSLYQSASGQSIQDVKRSYHVLNTTPIEAQLLGWDRNKTIAPFTMPAAPGGDTTPPQTVSASDPTPFIIRMVFTENMDPVTTADKTNYYIEPTAFPGVEIYVDYILVSGSRADLYLDTIIGFDNNISVEVQNVEDLAGNPIIGTHTRYFDALRKQPIITAATSIDATHIEIVYDEAIVDHTDVTYTVTELSPPNDTYAVLGVTQTTSTTFVLTVDAYPDAAWYNIQSDGAIDSDDNPTVNENAFFVLTQPVVDTDPPAINSITPTSGTVIEVVFNEDVDQTSAETEANWTLDGNNPTTAVRDAIDYSKVVLTMSTAFASEILVDITIEHIFDLATPTPNEAVLLQTTFTSYDTEAPTSIIAISRTRTLTEITFSEDIDQTEAVDAANYTLWETSKGTPSGDINISSVAIVNSYTVNVTSALLQQDVDYTMGASVSDVSGNLDTLYDRFSAIIENNYIRVSFTNTLNTEVTSLVQITIPFAAVDGPSVPDGADMLQYFSFEDDSGTAYPAEFVVTETDVADGSVLEIELIITITVPANSTIERWVVWGQPSPNVPDLPKENTTTSSTHGSTIDNKTVAYSMPSGSTEPVKDLRFTGTNRPAIRNSNYTLTIDGVSYVSDDSPDYATLNIDGRVFSEAETYSGLSTLDLKSTTKSFLQNNYIEVSTILTNTSGSAVTIEEFSLDFAVPHDWSYINYAPDLDFSKTTPNASVGLKIEQTSTGYQVIGDANQVLINYSGVSGAPAGDYSGWLATVSKNQKWYIGMVPDKIARIYPRTLQRTNSGLSDVLLNTSTILADGGLLEFNTILILGTTPIDVDQLATVASLITGGIVAEVSPNYLDRVTNPPDINIP